MASLFPTRNPKQAARGFTLVELLLAAWILAFISLGVLSAYLFMARNLERLMKTQEQDRKSRTALFYFTQDVGSAVAVTTATSTNLTVMVPSMLTLGNCSTTLGSATITCTSTASLVGPFTSSATKWSISGLGIPSSATISSVTNATTLVMSTAATATGAGLTLSVAKPMAVSYVWDSAAGTLTRTDQNGVAATLLRNIVVGAANPSNGFVYYTASGTAVTGSTLSIKSAEFAFTTTAGLATSGTAVSYVTDAPRVVTRNLLLK